MKMKMKMMIAMKTAIETDETVMSQRYSIV
jgi:hypothetical protein